VPIVPYVANSIVIGIGQRYEIVVDADQAVGNYWLRATLQSACGTGNTNANNILGIIRYDSTSTADPTTTIGSFSNVCADEALTSLVPYLSVDVGTTDSETTLDLARLTSGYNKWTIDGSSLYLNWSDPTTLIAYNGGSAFPTDYNVYPLTEVNEVRPQSTCFSLHMPPPSVSHCQFLSSFFDMGI
jgi:hypothetical protein